MRPLLIISLILSCLAAAAQSNKGNEYIQRGNEFYRKQQYKEAYNEYQKAIDMDPANPTARFNQANAVYMQEQKVDASKAYTGLLASTEDKAMRAKIFYNKGVILSDQKNIEESIEAYKNALRNDPNDKDARENLQKALLELKKKPPPEKKDDKKQNKNQQQQQQKQQQSMNQKETQQRLQLLQQKEKQVQERIQNEKSKGAGSGRKDW
jgi:Ca-activated chloride channel family protein